VNVVTVECMEDGDEGRNTEKQRNGGDAEKKKEKDAERKKEEDAASKKEEGTEKKKEREKEKVKKEKVAEKKKAVDGENKNEKGQGKKRGKERKRRGRRSWQKDVEANEVREMSEGREVCEVFEVEVRESHEICDEVVRGEVCEEDWNRSGE